MAEFLFGDSSWNAAPTGVAPDIAPGQFFITDAYENNDTVGGVTLLNNPDPAAVTYAITAGNTNSTFAINSSTGAITVAIAANLVADDNYSLQVTATNDTGNDVAVQQVVVQAAGAQTTLFTSSITNDSSATAAQAGDWTWPAYHSFVEGDVPAGTWPVYEVDSEALAYSYAFRRTHQDGSLAGLMVMFRLPSSVAAGASINYTCKNAGTAPAAGSRSATDGDGSADIKVEADIVIGGSGTWTAQMKYGTPLFSETAPGSGGPNLYLKRRQPFRQSSANHGQLFADFYNMKLEDANGDFYGELHLARVMQSYVDTNSPTRAPRGFSAVRLMDGASTLRSLAMSAVSRTFTADVALNRLNCSAAHGFEGYQPFHVTTDGVLPAPLAAGTMYRAFVRSSTVCDPLITPSSAPDITDSGSGTHTLIPLIALHHQNSFFTADTDARMDFSQSGGTGNAPTCVIKQDPAYRLSSRLFPPVNLSATHQAAAAHNYFPGCHSGLDATESNSGDGQYRGLAPMHGYFVRHFIRQTAADLRETRVLGLTGGHREIAYYDSTTNRIPVLNNQTYSGMGTAHPTWRGANGSFANMPFNDSAHHAGSVFRTDTTHAPGIYGYPAATLGEWQYFDMAYESIFLAIGYAARATIGATTYHGAPSINGSNRQDAWGLRDCEWARRICPDDAPERPYLEDIVVDRLAYYNDRVEPGAATNMNATLIAMGFYHSRAPGAIEGGFMIGYRTGVVAWVANGFDPVVGAQDHANFVAKLPSGRVNLMPAFNMRVANVSTIITSEDEFTTSAGTHSTCTYVADGTFTQSAATALAWDPVDDAVLSFQTPPSGLTANTSYYIRDANPGANTFKLAATPGGAAITLPGSGSTSFYLSMGVAWASGKGVSTNSNGYTLLWTGVISALNAVPGMEVDLTAEETEIRLIRAGIGHDDDDDSGWAFSNTYEGA